ncbi:hypothetical protein [Methylobacterium frigidaeris]|uniref:DUF4185 domain-containing protein n=1 Tax=Methylobacterium frigidaeris TaxID=2038277 RepID=A0AA37HAF0_9HYPH|nr:hypothetical protein [Methylobacterium frigidaeris]PIK68935.1 hypothetical protein CS379_32400 [Methylobacterium frigidaeris]GJD61969.1 hypothetical protein MPEAHAMD_2118 [Methylobacterium frigidaeris]
MLHRLLFACLCVAAVTVLPAAAEPPLSALTLVGPAHTVFKAGRDACDGHDVPDAPARALREADGGIALFGMHYRNRALRGRDFDTLKLDCRIVLDSAFKPEPEAFDDRTWITATWTEDGTRVEALLHEEYHADDHGRCRTKGTLACWYNAVLAARSTDGGRSFTRTTPPTVIAAPPFRQEVEQGRHRGFFNPSNIVADGRYRYFYASTTGWTGQPFGVCLFRSDDVTEPDRWRAFDGKGFTARFPNPYLKGAKPVGACAPVAPFPAPVGSVNRHRGTGAWIAVFQAAAGGVFPRSGIYWSTSRDLLSWDAPRLLIAGSTLYDDPCKAGGELVSYPSLIDPTAPGRNFDTVGDTATLYYVTLKTKGCEVTSDRDLVRRPVAIKVWP